MVDGLTLLLVQTCFQQFLPARQLFNLSAILPVITDHQACCVKTADLQDTVIIISACYVLAAVIIVIGSVIYFPLVMCRDITC